MAKTKTNIVTSVFTLPLKAVVMTKSPNYNIGKEEPIVSALFYHLFVPLSLKKIPIGFVQFKLN